MEKKRIRRFTREQSLNNLAAIVGEERAKLPPPSSKPTKEKYNPSNWKDTLKKVRP